MKSFCIHLKKDIIRHDRMVENMNRFCGFGNWEQFEAIEHNIGAIGCSRSHRAIIQMAKENKWPAVQIFEDDVYFNLRASAEIWNEAILQLPSDFDILSGGSYYWQDRILFSDNLYQLTGKWSSTHCLLVSERCYDVILSHPETEDGKPPIDLWLSKQGLKVFITRPTIAIQYDGWSNCANKETNYNETHKIFLT